MRFKPHHKPEMNCDFVRYPYGDPPMKVTGLWVVEHGGYDYASEQLDYEDHGMTMLHQRPTSWRSSWVLFGAVASLSVTFYMTSDMPFPGAIFGQLYMDEDLNMLRYLNDNEEEIHDWGAMKKQWLEIKAKEEA
jgi:hypothetical protein